VSCLNISVSKFYHCNLYIFALNVVLEYKGFSYRMEGNQKIRESPKRRAKLGEAEVGK